MKQKHMVLVPYWVENVLKRDRLSFAAVLDYAKMRAILPQRELSAFLSFQRGDKIDLLKGSISNHLLSSWEQSCPQDAKAELVSVVVPLSHSQDVCDEVLDRMAGDDTVVAAQAGQPAAPVHRIVDFERDCFALVLQRGAYERASIPAKGLEIARSLLKVFYGYLEDHEVSALPFFRKYLGLLQSNA